MHVLCAFVVPPMHIIVLSFSVFWSEVNQLSRGPPRCLLKDVGQHLEVSRSKEMLHIHNSLTVPCWHNI